jgi:hypothetical protein
VVGVCGKECVNGIDNAYVCGSREIEGGGDLFLVSVFWAFKIEYKKERPEKEMLGKGDIVKKKLGLR